MNLARGAVFVLALAATVLAPFGGAARGALSPAAEPAAPPAATYINGTVTDLLTHAPLTGATVVTIPWSFSATTDGAGFYEMLVPVVDSYMIYTLTARAPLYVSQTTTGVNATATANVTVDFALVPYPGWIAGMIVNASSTAIAGCVLLFRDAAGQVSSTSTDGSGRFNKSLAPGSYDVNASAPGYVSSDRPGVGVASNVTTPLNLRLNATPVWGWIQGTVQVGGAPLAGATVRVFAGNAQVALTHTDETGHYMVTLPPGSYAMNVSASGYRSSNRTGVSVAAGSITNLDFAFFVELPSQAPPPFWMVATAVGVIAIGAVAAVLYLTRFRRRP